jgi:isocitrate dehydrogenase
MADNEERIVGELGAAQGRPADLGGYYHARWDNVKQVMRPSATLNKVLADFG